MLCYHNSATASDLMGCPRPAIHCLYWLKNVYIKVKQHQLLKNTFAPFSMREKNSNFHFSLFKMTFPCHYCVDEKDSALKDNWSFFCSKRATYLFSRQGWWLGPLGVKVRLYLCQYASQQAVWWWRGFEVATSASRSSLFNFLHMWHVH